MINPQNRHATLNSQAFSIVSISLWIAFVITLLAINYLNFATVFFTINKDGPSLRAAESVLAGVCHRMPSRSFWILEVPLGLCSRCTGLYLSALLAALILPFSTLSRNNKILPYSMIGLLPLIIDGTLERLAIYSGNNLLRLATGLTFGYSIISIITHYHNQLKQQLTNWR